MDTQQLLEQAPGEWTGDYRLWMTSTDAPDAQSASRLTVTRELDGRSLVLRYDWRFDADSHEGVALVTRAEDGALQMGWSDTFHSAQGVMHSAPVADSSAVLAHYGPADAPWGWRTEFDMPSADELCIRAFNIFPDGREALATEATYRRVGERASSAAVAT